MFYKKIGEFYPSEEIVGTNYDALQSFVILERCEKHGWNSMTGRTYKIEATVKYGGWNNEVSLSPEEFNEQFGINIKEYNL